MSIELLAVALFVLILALGAFLALGPARSYVEGGRAPNPLLRASRIQQVKEARRMERQRGRVWWKVDNLHAEYLARTSASASGRAAPVEDARPARPEGSVTREQVDEMFAAFLNGRGG